MREIPLHFSDTHFGTEEFGFITVKPGEDPDDVDRRYERHLAAQGVVAQVDPSGYLVVEAPRRSGTLRLTEERLRRIIREAIIVSSRSPARESFPRTLREGDEGGWAAEAMQGMNGYKAQGILSDTVKAAQKGEAGAFWKGANYKASIPIETLWRSLEPSTREQIVSPKIQSKIFKQFLEYYVKNIPKRAQESFRDTYTDRGETPLQMTLDGDNVVIKYEPPGGEDMSAEDREAKKKADSEQTRGMWGGNF